MKAAIYLRAASEAHPDLIKQNPQSNRPHRWVWCGVVQARKALQEFQQFRIAGPFRAGNENEGCRYVSFLIIQFILTNGTYVNKKVYGDDAPHGPARPPTN